MAFGYKADYGYIEPGIINGQTNISDLTITDSDKWFVCVETTTVPREYHQMDQDIVMAHDYAESVTEYAGVTILPYNMFNTVYYTPAPNAIDAIVQLFPSAFRECPNLLQHEISYQQQGALTAHNSFVYLKDIDKVITNNSAVYNVASDGTLVVVTGMPQVYWLQCQGFSGVQWNSEGPVDFMVQHGEYAHHVRVIVTGDKHYGVYYDVEQITTEDWDLMKRNVFGSGEPEWERNPFDEDPYNPLIPGGGGSSKPGGGDGTFDFDSDDIVDLPDASDLMNLADTDLVSIYSPSSAQLHQLASLLWDENFIDGLNKLRSDPFDVIIGLHIVPVPLSGSYSTLKLGNMTTELVFKKVSNQFYEKSFGGMKIDEIWGAYLDYMCRIKIFLPFIGFVSVSPDDVFGHLLSVKYIVDAVTGGCVAFIRRDNECIATYGGNCAYQIPLTGANYSAVTGAIMGAVVTGIGVVAGVATGGLAAPLAAAAVAGTAVNTATAKPEYERSGALTGNIGYMGMRTPYLLIYAPNQCVPENQNAIKGYPSYITRTLGSLSGYTEVDTIHLDGITATQAEKDDIMSRLKAGVIL